MHQANENMERVARIGIVGCGAIGRAHAEVWEQIPRAMVTAVCDSVPERAKEIGARFSAAVFEDLIAMCASGCIDAVDICTPSGLHAEQGLVAASHGLHVITEKPLDLVAKRAESLVRRCDEMGVKLACVLQRRAYAGPQAVTRAIQEGKLGRLLMCSASIKWWRDQAYYDSSGWRGTRALDGGVLANQGIHALDHLCWMAGPVSEVLYAEARTEVHTMEAEDVLTAVVRFQSGATGVIEATTCSNPPLCSRVEVVGSEGAAAFDDAQVTVFGYGGVDRRAELQQDGGKLGGRSEAMAISLHGHHLILSDFAAALLEDRDPIVTGRDALPSVQALSAIYRAAGIQQ